MSSARLLAAFAAGALVALPGLAMAQDGLFTSTPSEEELTTEDPTDTETEIATEVETDPVEEEPEVEEPETDLAPQEQVDEEPLEPLADEEDEGHGEVISTLARCLPSGAALHGTGFTKGFVMSQAASTGTVVIEAHDVDVVVETPEDAEALCALIAPIAEAAEAPETAKGRPDWAGPTDGDVEVEGSDDAERGGPPAHARDRGPKGPKGPR